jgi:hypothetical protein
MIATSLYPFLLINFYQGHETDAFENNADFCKNPNMTFSPYRRRLARQVMYESPREMALIAGGPLDASGYHNSRVPRNGAGPAGEKGSPRRGDAASIR